MNVLSHCLPIVKRLTIAVNIQFLRGAWVRKFLIFFSLGVYCFVYDSVVTTSETAV